MAAVNPDIQAIFAEAITRDSDESRVKYLDEVCENHPEVRARVEALLRAHSEAGGFFGGQPAPTLDQPITEKPGTQIGPYKLLQQLGEGGMGVVYMAEQKEPVKRRVALKIIKPGMDTRQVIARFEAERQALAMMDHPNIAKVLDAGATESGRPYFVMELVNGVSITQYCDEQHLTPKERLELFVPICQAVQHAHQNGIIHRDLKPSNILVAMYDNKAVPKIIDFGVAKATSQTLTDKTMFTQVGQVVGTLEYMAPEQAQVNQLDVDTRSDIYSLGVVLYELLTGETPFDRERLRSAAFDEMLRIIREEEPSKPSTKVSSSHSLPSIAANRRMEPAKLGSMIRGELDWIVLKAMEKDRGRRYETASKFAEDVQHYLNDEAVVACPPSRAYKFRKFARRNKTALAMASIVTFSLLLVVGSIGWMARDHAARAELAAREQADQQQRLADRIELIVNEVDQLVANKQWLKAAAEANRAEAIIQSSDADEATQERVRTLLADLELVQQLENIRLQISQTVAGDWDRYAAADQYARVFREAGFQIEDASVEVNFGELQNRHRVLPELATALVVWSRLRRKLDSETDNARWQHLLAVADAIDPDIWRRRVRAAWKMDDEAASAVLLRELSDAVDAKQTSPFSIAMLAGLMEQRVSHDEAVSLWLKAQEQYPSDFWINFGLARCLWHTTPPRLDEAITYSRVAYALHPESAGAVNHLGLALYDVGRLDEATDYIRQAIELDPEHVGAYCNLGEVLRKQGRLAEAIDHYRRAISLNPKHPYPHNNLGLALSAQGEAKEAIKHYRKAIELDSEYYVPHQNLGDSLKALGKREEAVVHYRRAIELNPQSSGAHCNLGNLLLNQGKPDEAIDHYLQAITLDPENATVHQNLAAALLARGRLAEAIEHCRRAVALDPTEAKVYQGLGAALFHQGNLDEATTNLRQAIALDEEYAMAHQCLGWALYNQKKPDEAIASWRKALELAPANDALCMRLAWVLATAEDITLRDPKMALECARKALELGSEKASNWNILGVGLFRNGEFQAAAEAMEKARAMHDGQDPLHHFFLAMAYWKVGRDEDALTEYALGVRRMDGSQQVKDYERFREEAESLIGRDRIREHQTKE